MRILLRIELCTQTTNALVKNGTLGEKMAAILDEQKPEAAYFTDCDGKRTGFLVVNIRDASEIPRFAEPWFLTFNAKFHSHPCMVREDLEKAAPAIKKVAMKYG